MTGSSPEVRHAGLVVGRLGGQWRGGLIVGPSGSGKSTLALKLICQGWTLVSDDRTCLFQSSGRVFGVAPRPLVGLIEARGVAVAPAPGQTTRIGEILAIFDCTPQRDPCRIPAPVRETLAEVSLPKLAFDPFDAAAAEKFGLALRLAWQCNI